MEGRACVVGRRAAQESTHRVGFTRVYQRLALNFVLQAVVECEQAERASSNPWVPPLTGTQTSTGIYPFFSSKSVGNLDAEQSAKHVGNLRSRRKKSQVENRKIRTGRKVEAQLSHNCVIYPYKLLLETI